MRFYFKQGEEGPVRVVCQQRSSMQTNIFVVAASLRSQAREQVIAGRTPHTICALQSNISERLRRSCHKRRPSKTSALVHLARSLLKKLLRYLGGLFIIAEILQITEPHATTNKQDIETRTGTIILIVTTMNE